MSTAVANPNASEEIQISPVFYALWGRDQYWEDVTAEFLRESDGHAPVPTGQILWQQSYLAGVGAALELRSWQLSGLVPERLRCYPAWNQVLSLARDRASDPDCGPDPLLMTLQHDLFRVWFEESVWDAHRLLGAPIQAGELDVDLLVDAFARLLWANRHLAKTEE